MVFPILWYRLRIPSCFVVFVVGTDANSREEGLNDDSARRRGRDVLRDADEVDVHAVTTPNHASGMTDCTVAVFWARTVNWKTAPRGVFGETHNRPSCAWMIARQIDRPIPIPSDLVVKSGLNIRSMSCE